jgi:hypothetical protein
MKLSTCGCCEPEASPTPLRIENRPGLSAVAYRIGTYSSFRQAMLQAIASTPELASLKTRLSDDHAITILELWATISDVLTFYQERIANEGYLRTARLRDSVLHMARLIDYQLGPGAAATAFLAFTLEEEAQVRIPVGLRVQSVPGQDEKPQKFETLEATPADARLNRLRIVPAPIGINPLAKGTTRAFLAPGEPSLAVAEALVPGDRFLVFSAGSIQEFEVEEVQIEHDRVLLAWSGPIQGTSWDVSSPAFKVTRTFRLFGYDAPPTYMEPTENQQVAGGIEWKLKKTVWVYSSVPTNEIVLDSLYEEIAVGSRVLVSDGGNQNTLVTVTAAEQTAATVGPLSDTVTKLTLFPSVPPISDPKPARIYALAGPPIRFWGYSYPELLKVQTVLVSGCRIGEETIEVGRTIAKSAVEPGFAIAVEEIELDRRVLLQDAQQRTVAASINAVSLSGADVSFDTTAADQTTASELGLLPEQAEVLTGLASAALYPFDPFPDLSSSPPRLSVTIGGVGPATVSLAGQPATAADAASQLEAALQAADPDPAFSLAQVLVVDQAPPPPPHHPTRLLVLPGVAGASIVFAPTADDGTTVLELGFDPKRASPVSGLASGSLCPFPSLVASNPELLVSIGVNEPRTVGVSAALADLATAADELQTALNAADPAPAFSRARVLTLGDRLLVLPGVVGAEIEEYLRIDLDVEAETDLEARTAVLLGNVARASHGESVKEEILGDGDASATFQRFPLRKRPLTYVPSADPGGLASSLRVLVNRVLWREASSLYGQSPTAEVHTTRIADDGTVSVQFGDGVTGARPFSGRGNIMAFYRHGLGLEGRVRDNALTTLLDRPIGLKSVTNPRAAEGGADPETLAEARENAPTTVRTFGRAVSLLDFEDLAMASGEVAKARATWVWNGESRTVHLTLAGQEAAIFSPDTLSRIHAGLNGQRDPNHTLLLDNFVRVALLMGATLHVADTHVAEDVEDAARAALLEALSFELLRFGQPLHLSDIYQVLQGVPGVVWVKATLFHFKDQSPAFLASRGADDRPVQEHLRIYPARPIPGPADTVLPAEQAWIEAPTHDVTLLTSGGLPL